MFSAAALRRPGSVIRATIAHHAVLKHMLIALRVFVRHASGHYLADIGDLAYGNDTSYIEVLGVAVLFNRYLLDLLLNVSSHRHVAQRAEYQCEQRFQF